MRHGIPKGIFTGGTKGFFKAREAEKKAAEKKLKVKPPEDIQDIEMLPEDEPEVIVIEEVVDSEKHEFFHGYIESAGIDMSIFPEALKYPEVIDPVESEDIITEEELAEEVQTAQKKRGRRGRRKKKK